MRPEAQDHLDRARECLDEARKIAGIGLAKVAARSAYYVALHSAEALIAQATGKIAKSHSLPEADGHRRGQLRNALTINSKHRTG